MGSINGYEYRLYAVNGYQRSLIANKKFFPNSNINVKKPQYNIQKKFDFDDTGNSKSMCMYLDGMFISGCDGVYKYGNDIPGMKTAWSRPIKYPNGSTKILL